MPHQFQFDLVIRRVIPEIRFHAVSLSGTLRTSTQHTDLNSALEEAFLKHHAEEHPNRLDFPPSAPKFSSRRRETQVNSLMLRSTLTPKPLCKFYPPTFIVALSFEQENSKQRMKKVVLGLWKISLSHKRPSLNEWLSLPCQECTFHCS